jgi:Heavy-metal resistance
VRRWWLVIALLLSVGINIGLLAAVIVRRLDVRAAGEKERPGPPEAGVSGDPLPRVVRLADHLELEGEPRRRFIDLQVRFFQETLRLRLEMGELRRELRRELVSRDPDPERVERLTRESSRIHLALEVATTRNVLATREILDPRQERQYLRILSRLRPAGPRGLLGPGPERRPPPRWRQRLQRRFPRDGEEPPEGPP